MSTSPFYGTIAKYNSSGTLLWEVNSSADNTAYRQMQAPVADSSGNVYSIFYSNTTGSTVQSILKRTPSGEAVYCKALPTTLGYISDMAADNSNSCLYLVSGLNGQTNLAALTKVSMDGTLLWVRQLSSQSGNVTSIQSVRVDSSGFVYLCGRIAGVNAVIIKLPPGDAALGVWGDLVVTTNSATSTPTSDYTGDSFSLSTFNILSQSTQNLNAVSVTATASSLTPSNPVVIA